MKGDFTRFGFDARKHFSRVLHQQGRVTLDADANEASAIVLHHLRQLTRDLFGAAGGPPDSGFALALDTTRQPAVLSLSPGHYYVDGILCENERWTDYDRQPHHRPAPPAADGSGGDALLAWLAQPSDNRAFWLYLDVWERHVSWIEDDSIREPALGGPDTCSRAQVVWQLKALPWNEDWGDPQDNDNDACAAPLPSLPASSARLAARLDPGAPIADPCLVSPEAAYRGAQNQLYRVEVHRGGTAASGASFKWSRDNASLAARWLGVGENGGAPTLRVSASRGLAAGDWVELSHDALELAGQPGQMLRIAVVEGDELVVDESSLAGDGTLMPWSEALSNPRLRRWDQRSHDDLVLQDGAVPIEESSGTPLTWLALEDGIEIAFAAGGEYRSGDYWLIPARVATQGIDWPAPGTPQSMQPPQGIAHHYAPLGVLMLDDGEPRLVRACRRCVGLAPLDCVIPVREAEEPDEPDDRPDRPPPRGPAPSRPGRTKRRREG